MPCTCQNAFNKLSGGYKTIGCNCKGADYANKNCLKPEDVYEVKKDTSGKCTCKNPESIKKCCQCCAAASAPPPQEEEDDGLGGEGGEGGSIKSGGSKGSKNGKPKKFLLKISPESLEATCLCGEECTCTVCTCKPHTLYDVEDPDEIEDTCIELVETKKKCKNSQSLRFILRLTPEQMLQMCLVWCEENCECPLCVCRLEELFGCKKVTAVNIYCLLRLKKRRTGCVGISDLSGSGGGGGEGTGGQTGIGEGEEEGEDEESKISSDVSSLEYPPGTEESSESDMGAVIHAPCKCKDGSDKPKTCKELGLVCKKPPVCRKLPCGTCTCNPSPSCPPPPCRSYPCVPPPCPPPPRCPALKPPCRKPPPCPPPRCPRCFPPPRCPRCPPPKCPSRRCPPPPPCPPRCPPPPPCYRC